MSHARPDNLEDAPLGRESAYPEQYDPTLLYRIPRAANRAPLGIDDSNLPFDGEDEWHAFELSWLDSRGKPIVAVARFRLAASSPYLIESKSWKLYLNSFNHSRFEHHDEVRQTLAADLSRIAGSSVDVVLFDVDADALRPRRLPGDCIDDLDVEIHDYSPNPDLLSASEEHVEESLHSHLLKSNCPVTGQPDWGSVLIQYRGPRIDREGLLRYLVSYRRHQDFHEHCIEHIFTDLMARVRPETLLVMARYVRRGGLDISPWRATPGERPPEPLRLARQ